MLYALALILLVIWLICLVAGITLWGSLHGLLLAAIILALVNFCAKRLENF